MGNAGYNTILVGTACDLDMISDHFKADIDCCAKYALFMLIYSDFFKPIPAHYLKYNVTKGKVEDYYVPQHYRHFVDMYWGFTNNTEKLFADDTTAGGECLKTKETVRKFSSSPDGEGGEYFCGAYYVEGEIELDEDDKIIILGFQKDSFVHLCELSKMGSGLFAEDIMGKKIELPPYKNPS